LLPLAGYGYIVAVTSCPAARALSSFATASAAFDQLQRPVALR
jgi:hypothetical protein